MKKWIKYFLCIILFLIIAVAGYIKWKTSYNGNDKIVLLNSGGSFTSVADILKLPQFTNKVVYADVWGTTCPPCFDELKNYTPLLTEHYKNANDIVFLYLCIDRHPLPELRWKEKIQLLNPVGYHVLIKGGDEERKLATEIIGQATDGEFFPYEPCYFIVDKNGRFINKPTADPNKTELQPSDITLLYNRLDSVRHL